MLTELDASAIKARSATCDIDVGLLGPAERTSRRRSSAAARASRRAPGYRRRVGRLDRFVGELGAPRRQRRRSARRASTRLSARASRRLHFRGGASSMSSRSPAARSAIFLLDAAQVPDGASAARPPRPVPRPHQRPPRRGRVGWPPRSDPARSSSATSTAPPARRARRRSRAPSSRLAIRIPELLARHVAAPATRRGPRGRARRGRFRRPAASRPIAPPSSHPLSDRLGRPRGDEKRDLRRRLAMALVNAGRGGEASRAFLALAKDGDRRRGARAPSPRRRAAPRSAAASTKGC